jgi:hypothetical protein
MIQIEYLPIVLTGIGIIVSILYYASVLRNTNKTQQMQLETRQVQLYMDLHETRRSPEFQKLWFRVAFLDEWDDVEDYYSKYGHENNLESYAEHGSIWTQYDGIGFLLKKNVIDLSFIDDALKNSVMVMWNKFEPIIFDARERSGEPNLYNHFEYLVNELKQAGSKTPASL